MTDEDRNAITGIVAAAEQRTIEAMRDMHTEILKGIEAFARGNFARMHRLEVSDRATTERLAAIEDRLLMLETANVPRCNKQAARARIGKSAAFSTPLPLPLSTGTNSRFAV